MDSKSIKEHMEVFGSDGQHVGTVDCVKGADQIVLTKTDPKAGGQHHVIPMAWVAKVDNAVRLRKSAKDAIAEWQAAA